VDSAPMTGGGAQHSISQSEIMMAMT
jgi:hypothetical protein